MNRGVGLVQNATWWLWRHFNDQTSDPIPGVQRSNHVTVCWLAASVGSDVDDRRLDLVEHENRRPAMMMDWLFVIWIKRYFKDAKTLILVKHLVVLWSGYHGIQAGIPALWPIFAGDARHR